MPDRLQDDNINRDSQGNPELRQCVLLSRSEIKRTCPYRVCPIERAFFVKFWEQVRACTGQYPDA